MKLSVMKFGLLVIGIGLLMLASTPSNTIPISAAALVITPVEPATQTPKPANTPVTQPSQPTATHKPDEDSGPKLADPAITKEVNISEAKIGDTVFFTIRVTNNGPRTAEGVVVTDPIPDYMDVIEATSSRGDVSSEGRTVIVNIGQVARGEVVTIRITVRINERAQPPGGRNSVSLTTTSPGDNPDNNTNSVTFTIVGPLGTATPTLLATLTPTGTLALTPLATLTPVTPIKLPTTGAADTPTNNAPLYATLGLIAIGTSLLIRRKARK